MNARTVAAQMRACDTCSECCRTLAIDELTLPKKTGVWCMYREKGVGCTIYPSRPLGCRSFLCAWMQGYGGAKDRPDRTKIVLDIAIVANGLPGGLLQVWEARSGALPNEFARKATRDFLSKGVWVIWLPLGLAWKKLFVPANRELTDDIRRIAEKDGLQVALESDL